MGKKLWCYEPRCLLLFMTASVLLLPLRDSFQPGHVARRCGHQSLPAAAPRPWTPYCTLLPTRHPPRLLRPLEDSEWEPDVAGSNAEDAGVDDSDSDSASAADSNAAAAGGEQAVRAGVEGGDVGAINAEGEMRDWKQPSVQRTSPLFQQGVDMTTNTTPPQTVNSAA